MIIKTILYSTNMFRRTATTFACVTLTVFLTSCGGGSDGTSTTESADGMKQAQGVTGTTVPSGWKGRAPKMEVINGITVPPEPAPAVNNATLAGVDVNANGVRDDVERKIATVAQSQTSFDISIIYTSKLQQILQAQTPSTANEARRIMLGPECAINGQGAALASLSYSQLVFNTAERQAKIKTISKQVPPMTAEEVSKYECQ